MLLHVVPYNHMFFCPGDFPYPSLSDRELLKYLVGGERMEKPSNCTDEMLVIVE